MDIVAKHTTFDKDGVLIAQLDEATYREQLWTHKPLTDFWRVGRGYAKKLEAYGIYTMGDIARCSIGSPYSLYNEDLLYGLFGVNAELLIDHAWGYESCSMKDIKNYKPSTKSISLGQVLQRPYTYEEGKIILCEMIEALVFRLVEQGLTTNQITLTIGYHKESTIDRYEKIEKKHCYEQVVANKTHKTITLDSSCASSRKITKAVVRLYEQMVDNQLRIRKITLVANHIEEKKETPVITFQQLHLFEEKNKIQREKEKEQEKKEQLIQQAVVSIRKKYGKNAILKGIHFYDASTGRERNMQIGGHRA